MSKEQLSSIENTLLYEKLSSIVQSFSDKGAARGYLSGSLFVQKRLALTHD